MARTPTTHYEVLGVAHDAKAHEIAFVYQKWRSQMQKEDVAPDPHRARRMEKAYAVLSDPTQRAAYDASLAQPVAVLRRARMSLRARGGLVLGALVALGAAAYYAMRPAAAPLPQGPNTTELLHAASLAVARVQAIGMNGVAQPVGLAFAWGKGALGSSCRGIAPDAELLLTFGQRKVPAHVTAADEGNAVCRLASEGAGSWPLDLDTDGPRAGERVYAVRVNDRGEVALVGGRVRRIVPDPHGDEIDATLALPADASGGPLLNGAGRVIGIADAAGHHRAIPAAWIAEWRGPPPEAKAPEPPPEAKTEPGEATGDAGCPKDRGPSVRKMCEELNKASRIPSDL